MEERPDFAARGLLREVEGCRGLLGVVIHGRLMWVVESCEGLVRVIQGWKKLMTSW